MTGRIDDQEVALAGSQLLQLHFRAADRVQLLPVGALRSAIPSSVKLVNIGQFKGQNSSILDFQSQNFGFKA